uniref:YqaJ viral recombinase domain-containing protein n=1 Tax=Branchiostoma floridae TaxID=7739 RepID=C3ZZB5_BRAFL|eukprot:XP_002586108.1 hypothetical protein BRAFLDRAFT_110010 [Branchiostoma floridae]
MTEDRSVASSSDRSPDVNHGEQSKLTAPSNDVKKRQDVSQSQNIKVNSSSGHDRHWTDTFSDSDHDEEVVVVPEIEPNKLHPELAKLEPQSCQRTTTTRCAAMHRPVLDAHESAGIGINCSAIMRGIRLEPTTLLRMEITSVYPTGTAVRVYVYQRKIPKVTSAMRKGEVVSIKLAGLPNYEYHPKHIGYFATVVVVIKEMPRRLRLTIYPRKGGKGKVKTKAKVQGAPASDEAEWHTDEEDAMFQDPEYTARSPLCRGEKRCRSVSSTPRRILKWEQSNYISLQDIEELHKRHGEPLVESLQDGDILTKIETREIPQGTPEWHTIRSSARVTGSQLHKALGLESLKAQKEYFDRAVKKAGNTPSFSEEQKRAMAHGVEHEIDAAATLATKILPALEPNLLVYEEGCIIMKQDDKPFLVVSPDRSLRSSQNCTVSAVEIKCPYTADVHDNIPFRYLSQLHAEMAALQCPVLLYLSYKADCTNVFKVTADTGLWADIWQAAVSQYGGSNPVKPSHLTPESKLLKKMLKEKAEAVEFLGEFPSVTAVRQPELSHAVTSGPVRVSMLALEELSTLLMSVERLINEHYQLNRKKASEVVVQIVGNLDREWSMELSHGFPTNYFLKGYSLNSEVMRDIVEENHQKCHDIGIHIPCRSFDGQWRQLLVRDKNGNPLTRLQLQKDIWKEVCGQKKRVLVEDLKTIQALEWVVEKDEQTGKSVIRVKMQDNLPFPTTATVGWKTQKSSTAQESSVMANTADDDTSLLPISEVQDKMVQLGFSTEALFVRHIREGLIVAHDQPGISAAERANMRFRLRSFLMHGVSFHTFPPPGRYIYSAAIGYPWQIWEDTVASIEAHMILYPLVKQGSYNQRAFSSSLCEQFFSEMTGDDKTGHCGTLTAVELTRHFGTVCVAQERPYFGMCQHVSLQDANGREEAGKGGQGGWPQEARRFKEVQSFLAGTAASPTIRKYVAKMTKEELRFAEEAEKARRSYDEQRPCICPPPRPGCHRHPAIMTRHGVKGLCL